MPPKHRPSAVRAPGSGRDLARRREILGLAGDLAVCRDARQLCDWLTSHLDRLFPGTQRLELFVAGDTPDDLVAVQAPATGRTLLATLCAGIETLPGDERRAGWSPKFMPHLTVPNLIWPDETRGHGGMLSAPIVARSGLLGLLVLVAAPGAEEFAPDDLDMLCLVTTQCAHVLNQIRNAGNAADEAWMRKDLEAAKELQRTFLPAEPRVPGLRVVADYRPAYDIGGDFYDLIDHGRGRITALVGDVSGKGIAAALLMSRISSELRQLATKHFDPQDLLVHANHWLEGQSPSHQFASVAAVHVDLRAGTARVTNAGHPSPLLRKPNGMVIRLADASGPPLGMFPSQSYGVERFRVGTGDIIVLVTDGVLEALNQADDGVGMFSLVKLVARCDHNLDAVKRAVMDAVKHASGGLRDDATLLAFQIDEAPPAG